MSAITTHEGGEGVLMPVEPTEKAIEAIRRYRDSGCSIHNLYTAIRRALATTSSPDASPDSGEGEWITLRSLESDPRHLVVEIGGREVINTYFADGPVYHTAHPSPEAPANRQEAGE